MGVWEQVAAKTQGPFRPPLAWIFRPPWAKLNSRTLGWYADFRYPSMLTPSTPLGTAASTSSSATSPNRRNTSAALTIRSEEHTSELQSRPHLVCRLLLEKKK